MPRHAPKGRKRAHTGSATARRFVNLINSWRAEDSGYDERAWPKAKKAIEENRLSARRRFNE